MKLLQCQPAIPDQDYYSVLRVPRKATAGEIRSAYRRRALELYPDLPGPTSAPFIGLQQASAVLGDPARRAAYDRKSELIPVTSQGGALAGRRSARPFSEIEPIGGFPDISLFDSFGTFHPSFEELFYRHWSNFDLATRPKAERLESLTVDVPLSPQAASVGGTVRVLVPARAACSTCRGAGGVGFFECWQCRGQGTLAVQHALLLSYPAGLSREYLVHVPLDDLGIHNFYLTVRFRPTKGA